MSEQQSAYYREALHALVRTVADWPQAGVKFRDITPILQDQHGLRLLIDAFVHRYHRSDIDVVCGVDARGFILGAPLAYALNAAFSPIRKAGKLPAQTLRRAYKLEYGEAALEINGDAFAAGARVLLVDDLIATGGTLLAAVDLIDALGGELIEVAALARIAALPGQARLDEAGVASWSLLDF